MLLHLERCQRVTGDWGYNVTPLCINLLHILLLFNYKFSVQSTGGSLTRGLPLDRPGVNPGLDPLNTERAKMQLFGHFTAENLSASGRLRPLTRGSALDPAGGTDPGPHNRLALRARHHHAMCPPHMGLRGFQPPENNFSLRHCARSLAEIELTSNNL